MNSVSSLQSQLAQAQAQVTEYTQKQAAVLTLWEEKEQAYNAIKDSPTATEEEKQAALDEATNAKKAYDEYTDKLAAAQTSVNETQAALNTTQGGFQEAESLYNSTYKQVESTRVAYDTALEQKKAAQAAAKKSCKPMKTPLKLPSWPPTPKASAMNCKSCKNS